MAQKVEFVLSAQEADAVRAWLAVQRAQEGVNRKFAELDNLQEKTAKSGERVGRTLLENTKNAKLSAESIALMTTAWGVALDAGKKYFAEIRAAQVTADESANNIDALRRQWQVQSGLTGKDLEASIAAIESTSKQNARLPASGYASAIQLTSSGVAPAEAAGAGLNEFLRLQAATNALNKGDPRALAESIVSYIESQGGEKNAAGIAAVGVNTQRLFKGTNMQLADLQALAPVGASLKSAISMPEQLGAMSVFRDVGMAGSEGATALRNIVGLSRTFGGDQAKVEALAGMNLKPQDVDFIGKGEDLRGVLEKLADGLQRLEAERRPIALKTLFGQEVGPQAETLIGSRAKLAAAVQLQADRAGFEEDVQINQTGRNAARERLLAEKELKAAADGELDSVYRLALEAQLKDKGYSPAYNTFRQWSYGTLRAFGSSPEEAANSALGGGELSWSGWSMPDARGLRNRVEDAMNGPLRPAPETITVGPQSRLAQELQRELVDALKENTRATREAVKPPAINERPNVTPPATVNSALNDSRVRAMRP